MAQLAGNLVGMALPPENARLPVIGHAKMDKRPGLFVHSLHPARASLVASS